MVFEESVLVLLGNIKRRFIILELTGAYVMKWVVIIKRCLRNVLKTTKLWFMVLALRNSYVILMNANTRVKLLVI